jgi:hypothetical protein
VPERALVAASVHDRQPALSLRSARPFDAGQGAQDTARTGPRRSDKGGDASGLRSDDLVTDATAVASGARGEPTRGNELMKRLRGRSV